MKKEKKKKSEEKKGENKNGSGCASSSAFVAAIATRLSAAQVSIKGKYLMQSMTEFSRAISPKAGGERTAASHLAKQP